MSQSYFIKQCACKRSGVASAVIDGRLYRKACDRCGTPWRLNIQSNTQKQTPKRKTREPVH